MFQRRRMNLARNIATTDKKFVLIDSPSNLYYYTGFTGGEAMFLMPVISEDDRLEEGDFYKSYESQNPITGYIITDSRYYEQVQKECPDLELVRLEKKTYSETIKDILEKIVQQQVAEVILKNYQTNQAGNQPEKKIKIAVESSMNLAQYLKLCEVCSDYSFEIENNAIMESRMVKDEEELEKIAQAEAIGDAAFTHILNYIKPGVTEAELALEIEFFMKRKGASKLSFDTIVAGGPNSSMPHAQVTNRRLQPGDFITMDFGCVYQGYCSDMTRTVALGTPTEEMKKVYQIVLDANLRAMDGIREGIACNEIDALARDYIKKNGYGEYFGHGLGHGVGLDIHEEPRFSPKCDVITKENMVITDEPGIYIPGRFGVRIEDLLVVKKDGYKKLSNSEKSLIIL